MGKSWKIVQRTVASVFHAAAERAPDAVFCKSAEGGLSYAQAAGAVHALAAELAPQVKGRVVALVLPNSKSFMIGYYATLFAGGVPALINHGHPQGTIDILLADLDAALVISDHEHAGHNTWILTDATLGTLATPIDPGLLRDPGTPDTTAAILFSGGTTGLPKQVAHSNAAIIATMERGEWGWPTGAGETWLPVAPFTHIYGYLMGLVMASEKFAQASFPNLRVCPGGGAPFPMEVHRRWEAATGLKIYEGYGMTEIAPISINTERHGAKQGSAGKPVPDTEIEIVDLDTGDRVLPCGEAGEIRVKGPHMMTCYTGNPEETKSALLHGYVYTGDIGHLDEDGFLTITDRKKNVIFVSGFNVFPREIEELLLTHPAVSGSCVVGAPHPRSGEVPVAFVTLRNPCDADDIARFCNEHLIKYKRPAQVIILPDMPLSPAGKLDRIALVARLAEGAMT